MRLVFGRLALVSTITLLAIACNVSESKTPSKDSLVNNTQNNPAKQEANDLQKPAFDTADYNKRMIKLSNGDTTGRWPVKAPYPLTGAILPFNRVVAYYGNLFSTKMGALGEFPKAEMLKKVKGRSGQMVQSRLAYTCYSGIALYCGYCPGQPR